MRNQEKHSNPVLSKIKKTKNKTEINDQYGINKEDAELNNIVGNTALKQISINVSSVKRPPLKSISKLFPLDGNSVLNRSYSISQLAHDRECQKFTAHVKKQNQLIRNKIKQTNNKMQQLDEKRTKLSDKYQKLKQNQCQKLRTQISKLSNYQMF